MLNWGGRSGSKFGVVVLKASMLDWGVDLSVHVFGVAVLKASSSSAKFGVVVFKAGGRIDLPTSTRFGVVSIEAIYA